jgi:hypothetical protein
MAQPAPHPGHYADMTSKTLHGLGNEEQRRRSRLIVAAVVAILAISGGTAGALAAGGGAGQHPLSASTRDFRWRADISYLAGRLPRVHVDGVTGATQSAWTSAATRLAAEVPRLTNGQVIAGMARLVAMLHDDETQLVLPPSPVYPFGAQWVGGGLYLIAVPAAQRQLLGAQLTGIDGHPIAQVLARLGAEIDYQDPGLARALEVGWDQINPYEPGYLNNADLLSWLKVTRSETVASFTLRTASGLRSVSLRPIGVGHRPPAIVYVPKPLYMQHQNEPYWLEVLARQRAVYLKYNQCLDTEGFGTLSARAIALLKQHPGYRLIVDLRNNTGGASQPFEALITDIVADPAVNVRGRIFGLVNGFTDSSASTDAEYLQSQTHALLIGQQAADPIDEFGDDNNLLRLPYYRVLVYYTSAVVNPDRQRFGIPSIVVAPTVRDWLTGTDPVLAAALHYRG